MPSLLSLYDMPIIDSMNMPADFYVVLNEPSLLAGMCYPRCRTNWKNLRAAGFTGIVCLSDSRVLYNPYPLRMLYSEQLEDLHHGNTPRDPARQEMLVRETAQLIVDGLENGEGIIVHCVGGIGRTGTVIGCVLRELGFPADPVIKYLDTINKQRGVRGWPESEWQAEMVRRY